MQNKTKLFESRKIRSVWDEENEEWYFSVVDVVGVLTDSVNPTDYLKKLRKRDELLGEYIGTNCPHVEMKTETGKNRKTLAADVESLFRIIQSIPSPKAEPFKLWLAQVAKERLDQLQDPELSIEQAMTDYKRLGYSGDWINQRLKSIEIRKELTDEWKKHGLQEGEQFASLTDIIYQTWSGKTAKEYKRFKNLKKENLRDNMTNKELVINMLAELSTKEISLLIPTIVYALWFGFIYGQEDFSSPPGDFWMIPYIGIGSFMFMLPFWYLAWKVNSFYIKE